MSENQPGMDADTKAPIDRREIPAAMEPPLIRESSKHRTQLADLAVELMEKPTGLCRSHHPKSRTRWRRLSVR